MARLGRPSPTRARTSASRSVTPSSAEGGGHPGGPSRDRCSGPAQQRPARRGDRRGGGLVEEHRGARQPPHRVTPPVAQRGLGDQPAAEVSPPSGGGCRVGGGEGAVRRGALLAREFRDVLAAALGELPERQRASSNCATSTASTRRRCATCSTSRPPTSVSCCIAAGPGCGPPGRRPRHDRARPDAAGHRLPGARRAGHQILRGRPSRRRGGRGRPAPDRLRGVPASLRRCARPSPRWAWSPPRRSPRRSPIRRSTPSSPRSGTDGEAPTGA